MELVEAGRENYRIENLGKTVMTRGISAEFERRERILTDLLHKHQNGGQGVTSREDVPMNVAGIMTEF